MSMVTVENSYLALASLAEGFRTCTPPDIKRSTQCLFAILHLPINTLVMAKTHLQIGNMMLYYTTNLDVAGKHLEQAWRLSQNLPNSDDVRMEATSLLAVIYEKQNQLELAKQVLRKGLQDSSHLVYWHCKMLFQLAQIHKIENDFTSASNVLSAGAEFAHMSGAHYTRILFLLSRGMMLMIERRLAEAHPVLSSAQQLVEAWQGNNQRKESLKVFFLTLQVCHHLNAGQAKSVKAPLKILQQSIQNISSYHEGNTTPMDAYVGNRGDNFLWMSKEHMCILVYLVTVLHSMQAGYMDKAQKYTEEALIQIEKLKSIDDHPLLHSFQLIFLEHIVMCRIVIGNRSVAIKEIVQAMNVCWRDARLKLRHEPVIHALLGLYAMSMNYTEAAEIQLTAVLRAPSASSELQILCSLNLAIIYLRMNRSNELNDLLTTLNPEALPSVSQSLKAAAFYVLGLNAFFQARFNDAKRYLRDTLKMANLEDLNRLTSCSLVLLGHIFYSLANCKESLNMVTPAMELASRIPDIHVQLWATALLTDLYGMCNNPHQAQKEDQLHQSFVQMLLNDNYKASSMSEHNYIHWIGNDGP